MTDLVETIAAAAVDAISNQTPAITSDAVRLKSITLELELSNAGDVIDSAAWTERLNQSYGETRRRRTWEHVDSSVALV